MAENGWSVIKNPIITLTCCPFCGEEAQFMESKQHKMLRLVHFPSAGTNCPARLDQYCDSQEQGASWWNKRFSPGTKLKIKE